MRPTVICHMITSLDGKLHPSRWTRSPDGTRSQWSAVYEQIHGQLKGDGWIVGRVTMAEMATTGPHPPSDAGPVERPWRFARRDAGSFAITLDPSCKLHFSGPDIGGDAVVVIVGRDAPDSHLAELAADGVSYIVSGAPQIDLAAALDVLGRELGIRRLLLEGGAGIDGAFFAAGLVDEFSLLIAPAIDGRADAQSIVAAGEAGLADRVQLSLIGCETLDHGLVHLRYRVLPAGV